MKNGDEGTIESQFIKCWKILKYNKSVGVSYFEKEIDRGFDF